jgi:hypothetical protein
MHINARIAITLVLGVVAILTVGAVKAGQIPFPEVYLSVETNDCATG